MKTQTIFLTIESELSINNKTITMLLEIIIM